MGATDLTIRPLCVEDAADVSAFLQAQSEAYARFFYAIASDEAEIARILGERRRDNYTGVYWQGQLIGFFMLRGWDAGYAVPSFGVFIDEAYRRKDVMRVSLDAGKLIARLSGATRLMVKVHPDNLSRAAMTRLGFAETGLEARTGNVIYHMDL